MSLRNVIEQAGLGLDACADVLGVNRQLFQQWADSQKAMPSSYATILASMLGVKDILTSKTAVSAKGANQIRPAAIWFKFRGEEFVDADREAILAIRRLGHNANELEQATRGQSNRSWDLMFEKMMKPLDIQAAPQEQAEAAAKVFCELNQIGHGGNSPSEILRGRLRSQGILIIESSIPHSQVEGCSFYVGDSAAERPCIFVNTYRTTWFRRNVIIMHELAHAFFDKNSGGAIDTTQDSLLKTDVAEIRADAFAKATLLPARLLNNLLNRDHLNPTTLTAQGLAVLVAESGVEKKTVVEVMCEQGLIDETLKEQYLAYDIGQLLRGLTDHALTTKEYIEKIGHAAAEPWAGKRQTQLSAKPLLLPVHYVQAVVTAVNDFDISIGRAAELLMIYESTFYERFGNLIVEVAA